MREAACCSTNDSVLPKENLSTYGWYWEGASKDEVSSAIENRQDGTFIVRDSSMNNNFTLTLRVSGTTKLIKILCFDGKYGFTSQTLDFSSLGELIHFYRKHSLKDFNEQLNISLLHPLTHPEKVASKRSGGLKNKSTEIIKCQMEGLHAEYERISHYYDKIAEEKNSLMEEVQAKKLTLNSYVCAQNAFTVKIEMLKNVIEQQSEAVRSEFNANIELQKERIADLTKAQTLMSAAMDNMEKSIKRIVEEIDVLMPRLISVQNMRDKCRTALLERKVPKIDKFLEEINLVLTSESSQLSHFLLQIPMPWDPQTWLIMDGSKENAIGLINTALSNSDGQLMDGIFLIRPSQSRLGFFVLVITKDLTIHNCLIEYRDSTHLDHCGYGFLNTDMFFTTLADFVRYYSFVSLREHNGLLDTRLRTPALLRS